jgi:hypothetical protein
MQDDEENNGPRTTIWKPGPGGETLITTLHGLRFGAPQIGTPVHVPDMGQATCSGIQKTGSGSNEHIVEARFTLK